ncbi:MAG TPA: vWA domain-containing protein [Rhodanobacteraceae bacterium]|jgi:mxaC protein|nr:vWA domain-containing protein [Rhodanobacteraceae bacterium]
MLTHLHWTYPWALWALPLAVLPLFDYGARTFAYPRTADWPADRASSVLRALLRAAGAFCVAALVVASAAPYLEGGSQTLSGQGAEIVIVLDRSGSMSEPLIGTTGANDHHENKINAARRVLLAFMQRRPGDTFGMTTFNASPIGVAPLSEDRGLVEAGLVSAEARSEGYTAPASALALALDYFRERPLTAARIVLLVSDGGATIKEENREKLRALFAERHATLIWIYTRGDEEPSILAPRRNASTDSLSLHEFFGNMGSPYEMFEVTSPEGLERAVSEVGRMTNLPTRYEQRLPRRDLAEPLFALALAGICILIAARSLEVREWQV